MPQIIFPHKSWEERGKNLTKEQIIRIKGNAKVVVDRIEQLVGEVGKKHPRSLPRAGELVKEAKSALEELKKADKPGEILRLSFKIDGLLAEMHTIINPRKTFTPVSLREDISKDSGVLTKDEALKLAESKVGEIKEMEKMVKPFNASKAAALVGKADLTLEALKKVEGTDEKPLRLALTIINGIHTGMSALVAQKKPQTDFSSKAIPLDLQ
ncbi:MAG: hypothetical protein AB1468_04330 [Candidatus Micrarchaeota archaeon]